MEERIDRKDNEWQNDGKKKEWIGLMTLSRAEKE